MMSKFKMKLDAMKRQAGRPSKENGGLVDPNLIKGKSRDILAEQVGESAKQISRYVRLTELVPELLQMVDDKKIAFNPAVELSYLNKEEQTLLLEAISAQESTPSLSQAQRKVNLMRCTYGMIRNDRLFLCIETIDQERPTN